MTTRDVMQHVRMVQRRIQEQMWPMVATAGARVDGDKPLPRDGRRITLPDEDVPDERQQITREAQRRQKRAKACLKKGGPEPSKVC